MAKFYSGLLIGAGKDLEYEVAVRENNSSFTLCTEAVDKIVGIDESADFTSAPYVCTQRSDGCAFIISGYDKEKVESLANIFINFLHLVNPKFLKVPPIICEK